MSDDAAWRELGIARTSDAATIRSAYAAKLKTLDADRDPAAFVRLRRARDGALASIVTATPIADDARPATPTEARDAESRLRALLRAADRATTTPLEPAEASEARDCLRAMLARRMRVDLDRQEALERSLVDAFARSWPRCAPLLEEAAEALGWARSPQTFGETTSIALLNARLASVRFHRDVQLATHPLHGAWLELHGSRTMRFRLHFNERGRRRAVGALLRDVRSRHPEAEVLLDPRRVATWDRRLARPYRPLYVYLGSLALVLILLDASLLLFLKYSGRQCSARSRSARLVSGAAPHDFRNSSATPGTRRT